MPSPENRYTTADIYGLIDDRDRTTLEANLKMSSTRILAARMLAGSLARAIRYDRDVSSPWEALEQRRGNCFAFCELVCRSAQYLRDERDAPIEARRATNERHFWPFIKIGDTWMAAEQYNDTPIASERFGSVCAVTDADHIAVLEQGEGRIVTPLDFRDSGDWREMIDQPAIFSVDGQVNVRVSRDPISLDR